MKKAFISILLNSDIETAKKCVEIIKSLNPKGYKLNVYLWSVNDDTKKPKIINGSYNSITNGYNYTYVFAAENKYDFFVFTNTNVLIPPGALENMFELAAKGNEVIPLCNRQGVNVYCAEQMLHNHFKIDNPALANLPENRFNIQQIVQQTNLPPIKSEWQDRFFVCKPIGIKIDRKIKICRTAFVHHTKNPAWQFNRIKSKEYYNKPSAHKNKIAVVTCMYKRHILTDYVFAYYKGLQKKLSPYMTIELYVAGSEGNVSEKIAQKNNWNYVEFPNEPLTQKFNQAILLCKEFKPDGVVLIGSDDLLSEGLFYFYDTLINMGIESAGFHDAYVIGVEKKQMVYWAGYPDEARKHLICGLGRFFSRACMEKMDWKPWSSYEYNSSCDTVCTKLMQQLDIHIQPFRLTDIDEFTVDFKNANNLTNFDNLMKLNSKTLDMKTTLTKYLGIKRYNEIKELLTKI